MRVLATLMLIVSLVALSIGSAGAAIQTPSCGAQFRADTLCYAADRPGPTADPAKKPCACLVWLVPSPAVALPAAPPADRALARTAVLTGAHGPALPWRPPRA